MNLVIDIGNTFIKVAVFEGQRMLAYNRLESLESRRIQNFIADYNTPAACIISSVQVPTDSIIDQLGTNFPYLLLDHLTLLPFRNFYATPETLGNDRVAGIAAAFNLFPGQDVLVIDAGTAITYDLLTAKGEYLGGAISPGISMRYKALHTFTRRLPLLDSIDSAQLIGNSTNDCIHSGVLNGVLGEVEGTIQKYMLQFPALQILITGGDHNYFDKQLKVKTFAAPNLVLEGLNFILSYNLEKK